MLYTTSETEDEVGACFWCQSFRVEITSNTVRIYGTEWTGVSGY